jgi:hypothetical protein
MAMVCESCIEKRLRKAVACIQRFVRETEKYDFDGPERVIDPKTLADAKAFVDAYHREEAKKKGRKG